MGRTLYEITAGSAKRAGTVIAPNTWTSISTVKSVRLVVAPSAGERLAVNTEEDLTTAEFLKSVGDSPVFETDGRIIYVRGAEGQEFIADDGV